jgi:hypothetical protein
MFNLKTIFPVHCATLLGHFGYFDLLQFAKFIELLNKPLLNYCVNIQSALDLVTPKGVFNTQMCLRTNYPCTPMYA